MINPRNNIKDPLSHRVLTGGNGGVEGKHLELDKLLNVLRSKNVKMEDRMGLGVNFACLKKIGNVSQEKERKSGGKGNTKAPKGYFSYRAKKEESIQKEKEKLELKKQEKVLKIIKNSENKKFQPFIQKSIKQPRENSISRPIERSVNRSIERSLERSIDSGKTEKKKGRPEFDEIGIKRTFEGGNTFLKRKNSYSEKCLSYCDFLRRKFSGVESKIDEIQNKTNKKELFKLLQKEDDPHQSLNELKERMKKVLGVYKNKNEKLTEFNRFLIGRLKLRKKGE